MYQHYCSQGTSYNNLSNTNSLIPVSNSARLPNSLGTASSSTAPVSAHYSNSLRAAYTWVPPPVASVSTWVPPPAASASAWVPPTGTPIQYISTTGLTTVPSFTPPLIQRRQIVSTNKSLTRISWKQKGWRSWQWKS